MRDEKGGGFFLGLTYCMLSKIVDWWRNLVFALILASRIGSKIWFFTLGSLVTLEGTLVKIHWALVWINYALVTIVRTVSESIIDLQTVDRLS